MLRSIKIYTDGSSLGNPGRGGFAAIIFSQGKKYIIKGGEPNTTNNRMEMTAMIKALEWVQKNCASAKITLYSDSNLLIQSLNLGWKKKANLDLWMALDKARAGLNISYVWVKGHADNQYNSECDILAVSEAEKVKEVKVVKKSLSVFFCGRCQKNVKGILTWNAKAGLIRVDCDHCRKFIKFAPKTKENLERAKRNRGMEQKKML